MQQFDNYRPVSRSLPKSEMPAWVWALLIPLGVFLGFLAYEKYTVYRLNEAAGVFVDQMNKNMADLNRQQAIDRARAERNRIEAAREARNMQIQQNRVRLAQSVSGCAADAKRTKCTCFDATARPISVIGADVCLMSVDRGVRWLQSELVNGSVVMD